MNIVLSFSVQLSSQLRNNPSQPPILFCATPLESGLQLCAEGHVAVYKYVWDCLDMMHS